MRKKLPYRVGDWFAVPLRTGGFAAGRIARAAPRGRILLGYFFGPKRADVPRLGEPCELRPHDAVLVARFGDLGLIEGHWPNLGQQEWDPSEWPMPCFRRVDIISGQVRRIRYDPDDPGREIAEETITAEAGRSLPRDGLSGYGAIEIALTEILEAHPRGG